MVKRLQQLEKLNQSLKSELKEKNEICYALKEENKLLTQVASADSFKEIAKLTLERDKFKA